MNCYPGISISLPRNDQYGLRLTLTNVLGEGQINILKLSFEAAEQLTLDLVKMIQQMIDEIELKIKKRR
nr:Sea4 [Serratia entomophila]ULG14470.1 Sea4 [Serratia proteamaculans]ULG10632.1 Sea4 [Serratia entomophila]ULG10851.1 Sea4 [Serratia entomophila]ULG11152.1 Sea4 [Serratia entomophila]